MNIIFLIASILALFLSTVLLVKKYKSLADYILLVWLSLIGLHTFIYYLFHSQNVFNISLLILNSAFPFLQGPLLFFYTASLTGKYNNIKKTAAFHLLPFLIFVLYQLIYSSNVVYSNDSIEQKIVFVNIFSISLIFNMLILFSVPVYIVLSLRMINSHKQNISNEFSSIDTINLNWLKYIIWGMGLIWITVFAVFIIFSFSGNSLFINSHPVFFAVTLFVYFIGLFGIKQRSIFAAEIVAQEKHEEIKYKKSGLNNELADLINKKLIKHIEEKKSYLKPQLTLTELANELYVSPNNLSQVINDYQQKNFYDFINQYRVNEVISCLKSAEFKNYTLLAIALECGFNSKTSFNRIFKKLTGKTPGQFTENK